MLLYENVDQSEVTCLTTVNVNVSSCSVRQTLSDRKYEQVFLFTESPFFLYIHDHEWLSHYS